MVERSRTEANRTWYRIWPPKVISVDSLLRVSPYRQHKWRIILTMKALKSRFSVGVALFVAYLGVTNAAQQRSTAPTPKARIEGTVVSAAGNTPVAGVTLSVL